MEVKNEKTFSEQAPVIHRSEMEKLADECLPIVIKQYDTSDRFQKPIFDRIQKNEDMLSGKSQPALKGRNNVPLDTVIVGGFQDTLLSGMDEPVNVKFKKTREQDLKASNKITAVWDREKAPSRGNFDAYILDAKNFASVSGRGFLKIWVESKPKFRANMYCCDHFDMRVEPMGGPDLDRHLYKGETNIFRSTWEVQELATEGTYNEAQVRTLRAKYTAEDFKKNQDTYKHKMMRYAALGLDIEVNDFVGEPLFNLTEWVFLHKNKWYYMVFDYRAKTWVRFDELINVFSHAEEYEGRGPWTSFATHRHPKMFWSKAILDDVRPIAYTMKKILNLSLDNLQKRNWDMKAYDPAVFKDPTQLLYKEDGLARATLERGKSIQSGIFQFTTPDTTAITVNLNQYLDQFLSTKTGISNELQSKGQDTTNGIYFGNIQQSQNRIGLKNKMFYQAMTAVGAIFDYGCYKHLSGKYAVKVLGPNGVEWEEEITKKELEADFAIEITGGNDEERQNAVLLTRKNASLTEIQANPALAARLNPNWLLRERLSAGGYDDEAIRVALDTQNDGDEEILSEAAEAIYEIIEGKDPKINRGATTGYVQKILDYCYDTNGLSEDLFARLLSFANVHIEIARRNTIRRAASVIAQQGGNVMDMNAAGADAKMKARLTPPGAGGETVPAEQTLPGEGAPAETVPGAPIMQ